MCPLRHKGGKTPPPKASEAESMAEMVHSSAFQIWHTLPKDSSDFPPRGSRILTLASGCPRHSGCRIGRSNFQSFCSRDNGRRDKTTRCSAASRRHRRRRSLERDTAPLGTCFHCHTSHCNCPSLPSSKSSCISQGKHSKPNFPWPSCTRHQHHTQNHTEAVHPGIALACDSKRGQFGMELVREERLSAVCLAHSKRRRFQSHPYGNRRRQHLVQACCTLAHTDRIEGFVHRSHQ